MRAFAVLALAAPLLAQSAPRELAREIAEAGLDPEACYQVHNLRFAREDAKFYLTYGRLIFGKPVHGARFSALFSGEIEGGDAELLLLPPYPSERLSLAHFAGSPNLDEHFRTAAFIFTDRAAEELLKTISALGSKKTPEEGTKLAEAWDPVVRNLSTSFNVRLVRDALADAGPNGFFFAALAGRKLGNFDFLYDPQAPEQIALGQTVVRLNHAYFDVWTRFPAQSFRTGRRTPAPDDVTIRDFHIDATLAPDLSLQATTDATIVPGPAGRRVLSFDISPHMRVTEASIDGQPAEVYQPDSIRANLIRGETNQIFLVLPPHPLEPGKDYRIEFKHSGSVVTDAGNGVYFVGARSSWYPNRLAQFSKYDLTFRYPADLDLVATGRTVEQSTEGDWRIARHRIETPVRMAGFNLGRFEHYGVSRAGYTVDVYANRRAEAALEQPRIVVAPPPPRGVDADRHWTVDLAPFPAEPPKIKPAEHLERLAVEITSALEFMAGYFGQPVLRNLTVSPIPGTFGQGFPGLIYLSTLAYLDPKYRPAAFQNEMGQLFYSEIMHAHETAHQWWGNLVASASPEDEWLMEALANYSALLYLEKHKGTRVLDQVLASYKEHLLAKTPSGRTVDSAGPIIWGQRLESSQSPDAYRVITYEKGSWIMHMLRRRLGDDRFLTMLGDLRTRYQFRTLTTDEFRKEVAAALPPKSFDPQLDSFFEQWVYSTGIPALKLTHTVRGRPPHVRLTGTITQSEVDNDFSVWVPVEIQLPKGKPLVEWVRTSSDPVTFTVLLKQPPVKLTLDPGESILRR